MMQNVNDMAYLEVDEWRDHNYTLDDIEFMGGLNPESKARLLATKTVINVAQALTWDQFLLFPYPGWSINDLVSNHVAPEAPDYCDLAPPYKSDECGEPAWIAMLLHENIE